MAENKAATFEASLRRLEAIVGQLESDTVSLDQSVALFQEGRELARRCEDLLKTAQEQIDAAVAGEPRKKPNGALELRPAADAQVPDDEIPF
jgi:exodeoxyribonuclease VII small subunit